MLQEALDFRAEVDALHPFFATLAKDDWSRPTRFKSWTPWDVVAHLHFFDGLALSAVRDPQTFAREARSLVDRMVRGTTMAQLARERLAQLAAPALLAAWRETALALAGELGERTSEKKRIPWFGPDMSAASFAGARQMETWAHAQAICDLLGAPRRHGDRLRNIALLGIKTFGWTFTNRGLPVPEVMPYVRLVAPSGAVWEWNAPREDACVRGDAVSFCQVVTQVRNVADTPLAVVGETARRWMSIAQCFAGPPVDPPPPGFRSGNITPA